jgi:hypothetical protein
MHFANLLSPNTPCCLMCVHAPLTLCCPCSSRHHSNQALPCPRHPWPCPLMASALTKDVPLANSRACNNMSKPPRKASKFRSMQLHAPHALSAMCPMGALSQVVSAATILYVATVHALNLPAWLSRSGSQSLLSWTRTASVKVRPGGGRSRKCHGTRDNWRRSEPGPELQHVKGTKHKAWTEVRGLATLAEGMGRRGVASSKSDVVGSQKGSGIAA